MKKWLEFCDFKTSGERIKFDKEIAVIDIAKISAPPFRILPENLSMPAALDGFKPSKILNAFSGDVSKS